jgi:pimeloyl-ACP methyl ester carboxylesterase
MHGKYWVFLRGLIRQHRHWEDFPLRFEAAFPGVQVLTLDLPGNGDLHDRESPVAISGMVDSVRKQLEQRNIHGPVNVLAVSLGAMTTISWMERFPHEIERGVLINTSLRGMSGFRERLRPANYGRILRSVLSGDLVARERTILDLTTNLYPHKDMLAHKWAGYAAKQPTSRSNSLRQLAAATSFSAPKARPHEHVLVLQSLADHLVEPVCSTRMAESWRWPLLVHPTAGHDLTLDDGDWVIKQVKQWVAGEIDCPR